MKKVKIVKVGMLVSVPDRICYPGRRDPYEWENGIIRELSEDGKKALVRVKRYSSNATSYERWFPADWAIKKVSYSHEVGEEEKFLEWVARQEGVLV